MRCLAFWQGQKDLKLLRNPSCGARNCFAAWSAAQFRPLRQPLLPLSATGGGRKRCPARSASLGFFCTYQKSKASQKRCLAFWQGQKDLNPRHAVLETAALPTELYPYIRSAAQRRFLVGHQGLEPRTDRL